MTAASSSSIIDSASVKSSTWERSIGGGVAGRRGLVALVGGDDMLGVDVVCRRGVGRGRRTCWCAGSQYVEVSQGSWVFVDILLVIFLHLRYNLEEELTNVVFSRLFMVVFIY